MALFDWLNTIDTDLFLSLNGRHSAFFDSFFTYFTAKETWYPFYILLMLVILHKYKMKGIWVLLFVIITIVLSDQLSVFIKELVERLRPSHEPGISQKINLPTGKGGKYGFVSSHAANSFALAVFIGLVAQSKRFWGVALLWALLTAYSRIYVGVHYPFDVLAGGLLGAGIAWGMFSLLKLFDDHFLRKKVQLAGHWESVHITPLIIALVFTSVTLFVLAELMMN